MEYCIGGLTAVSVHQVTKSPVDFKPRSPALSWSALGNVDPDYADAMGEVIKDATETAWQWDKGQ